MSETTRYRFRDFTVAQTPDAKVHGLAECRDLGSACDWETTEPMEIPALNEKIAQHANESGHTAFIRIVSDPVTVTLGRWDGE